MTPAAFGSTPGAITDDVQSFDPVVLKSELEQILLRRISHGQRDATTPSPAIGDSALPTARKLGLIGLALSGGGIRSATFNLGILQGLASLDLLPRIDYLSTVSGGGYIGGWLAAWIRRDGFAAVEKGLNDKPKQIETASLLKATTSVSTALTSPPPGPIGHLRAYSNYLAPINGLFSADRWALWANYLRNFLLNQMVLLPLLIIALIGVRALMWLYLPWSDNLDAQPKDLTLILMRVVGAIGLISLASGMTALFYGARVAASRSSRESNDDCLDRPSRSVSIAVIAMLVFAIAFCAFVPYTLRAIVDALVSPNLWPDDSPIKPSDNRIGSPVFSILASLIGCLAYLISRMLPGRGRRNVNWRNLIAVSGAGAVSGAMFYGVYYLLNSSFAWDGAVPQEYLRVSGTAWALTVGPPFALLTIVATISIGVGILKDSIQEVVREWWASVCGRLMLWASGWLAFLVIALYATPLVLWTGPYVQTFLTSSWVISVFVGVVAGGSAQSGKPRSSNRFVEILAWTGPYLFLIGILIGVSLFLHTVVDAVPHWREADEGVWMRRIEPPLPEVNDKIERKVDTHSHMDAAKAPSETEIDKDETRSIEHHEVVPIDEIVKQMYWIGFLNVKKEFVPFVKEYDLKKAIDKYNETTIVNRQNGPIKIPQTVKAAWDKLPKEKQKPLNPLHSEMKYPSEHKKLFDEALRLILNDLTPRQRYQLRFKLTQWAKNVELLPPLADIENTGHLLKRLGIWTLGALCVMLIAIYRVDVNLMSLQNVYGNRLVRCYLGASRPPVPFAKPGRQDRGREPDPFTGFDPDDDLFLDELQQNKPQDPAAEVPDEYCGPYLIVNSALNLVHGGPLEWQDRVVDPNLWTKYPGVSVNGIIPSQGE